MEIMAGLRRSGGSAARQVALLGGLLVAGLLAGCASNSMLEGENRVFARVYTPQVPEFLSGPAAALLTNSAGFSARVTYESHTPVAPGGVDITEGELLGRGTRLLFAPRTPDKAPKEFQLGGFSFIWDVATASGFVLSEALQAYAPVASSVKPVGVSLQPGPTGGEEQAVVTLDNRSSWLFHVARSGGAVPTRIRSVTNSPAFTLKLAKVRHEAPAANLFVPPDGFAKYPTPEAMADELASRKNSVRRGVGSEMERRYLQNK